MELEVSKSDSLVWLRILRRICALLGLHPSGGGEGFGTGPGHIGLVYIVGAFIDPRKLCTAPIWLLSSFFSPLPACNGSCELLEACFFLLVSLL